MTVTSQAAHSPVSMVLGSVSNVTDRNSVRDLLKEATLKKASYELYTVFMTFPFFK